METVQICDKNTQTIIKKLSKLFNVVDSPLSEIEVQDLEVIHLMDDANVLLIISKTEGAKQILRFFVEKDTVPPKIPNLDYRRGKYDDTVKVRLCAVYLLRMCAVLEADSETIALQAKTDYPLTLESEKFRFVLAPRICND